MRILLAVIVGILLLLAVTCLALDKGGDPPPEEWPQGNSLPAGCKYASLGIYGEAMVCNIGNPAWWEV